MSFYCGKLCSLILAEHFGSIIQTVGDSMFKNGTQTLGFIRSTVRLPVPKVKESLCVLIKHGLVTHEQTEKGMTYTLHHDRVTMMLRYSRYMYFVKTCCGDEGEMILEEILRHGCDTASKILLPTAVTLKVKCNSSVGNKNCNPKFFKTAIFSLLAEQQVTVEFLKDKFELLVKNQFLMRSLSTDTVAEVPTDKPDYDLPDLNLAAMNKIIAGNTADAGDGNVYWKVNFDRLIQDLRDQIIVQATTRILDENAGELMRQLLFLMYIRTASWADTSNPIPFTEIKDSVRKLDIPTLYQYSDQYLRLIEEDSSQFLKRVGDSGGGQFSVNMKEAFAQLAWVTVGNIVMERFGSKAARIFRLVRSRQFVEIEQIQQLAMIPAKESKHLTYTLLQENYLQMQEMKKVGIAAAPTKAFFLFHIDLNQVVRMEIEHCYQALYNIMFRREHESAVNRRMIDKQMRMQTLTSNLKEHGATEEQLTEIAEMMTPSEKQQLDKVQTVINKLGGAELQSEETLFLLKMYQRYH